MCASHGACRADTWLGRDKLEHFGVTAAMAAAAGFVAYNHFDVSHDDAVAVGFGVSLGLGGLKEIVDANVPGGQPSAKDIVADLLGALAGAALLAAIIAR